MKHWLAALAKLAGTLAQKEAGRLAATFALWLTGGLLVLVALGFATGGVYVAIRNGLGPIPALFIMAAIFLAMAIVLFMAAARRGREQQPREAIELPPELQPDSEAARLASVGTVAAAFAFGLVRGLARRRNR